MEDKSLRSGLLAIAVVMGVAAILVMAWWFTRDGEYQQNIAGITALQGDNSFVYRRQMVDLSLHTPEEIRAFLQRAEKLADRVQSAGDYPGIALVLHGPEIEYFAGKNYNKYKDIVDLAGKLDKGRVIDIKVCETTMRKLGVNKSDMPAFVEPVPYGPDELKRLERKGYTYL